MPTNLPPILALALAVVVLLASLPGCRPRPPRRPLYDRDPIFVIPAIAATAEAERRRDIPRLIELLESEDAAIRLYSIEALERLTGQDHGYRSWHNPTQRAEAIGRWRRWAVERGLIPPDRAPPDTPLPATRKASPR